MNKQKSIFAGYTIRQFLIYLLAKNSIEKDFIILQKHFPDKMEIELKKRKIVFLKLETDLKKTTKGIFSKLKNEIIFIKNSKKEIKKIPLEYRTKNTTFIGESIISKILVKKNNLYILEDGIMNYKDEKNNLYTYLKKIIYYLLFSYVEFPKNSSLDKRVKKVYLTGISKIPKNINSKVEIINLKKLWNSKSERKKTEILTIFGFSNEIVRKLEEKTLILFTQPLNEDGLISEKEKIEIYKKALEKYKIKDVIIKTHPREKTEYRKYFPEAVILDDPFPFELVTLMEIKFKKVITLFSTVVLNLGDDVEVEWLGTKVHKKLFDKLGDLNREKFEKKD